MQLNLGAVPKTFFVDEHGVVQDTRHWEQELAKLGKTKPVTNDIRSQWSASASRLDGAELASLVAGNLKQPYDLTIATQLGSRYLALRLYDESRGWS